MADQPTGSAGSRGRSAVHVGLFVAGAYLLVSGLAGGTLYAISTAQAAPRPGSAAAQPAAAQSASPQQSAAQPTRSPQSEPSPGASSAAPSEQRYQAVSADIGLRTVVPAGWSVHPQESDPASMQADDPGASPPNDRFVRWGGFHTSDTDINSRRRGMAEQFSQRSDIADYRELELHSGLFHGYVSVTWEFEFRKDGVLRHVRAQYWQVDDRELNIYVSAPADQWSETRPVFDAMISRSTP